jgi:hypothetical protein
MKKLIYITLSCVLLLVVYSCNKSQTEFKKFQNGKELIYTGAVGNVVTQPGNLRVGLKWKSSSDPSITKYVIYWNNKADSQVVSVTTKTDSIKTIITGLQEFVYSFTIYSYDAKGNNSIAREVNNVKVYGSVYASTLLNRAYNAANPYVVHNDGSVTLNFKGADTSVVNGNTIINYNNAAGVVSKATLLGKDSVVTLPSYQSGGKVTYQSSYYPDSNAIDAFTVTKADQFPDIFVIAQCNKALFTEVHLPQDVSTYESGTSISKLWDGSNGPQGYPNIFHSDGSYIPHVLTFDMGKSYNSLSQLEEVGRNCCNNPDQFEVWGINDLTGATTTLRADNSGWKAEAIAKGWILLKSVTRSDDGQAALKVDLLSDPPPIRYIRIRVLHTVLNSGYSNMSEMTFWNRQ